MEYNPFSFMMVPLEWLQPEEYKKNSGGRGEWKQRFRWAATPKEHFWIEEEQTLWPLGWNSQWPGKPITTDVICEARTFGPEAGLPEGLNAKEWPTQRDQDPNKAMGIVQQQPNYVVCDVLHQWPCAGSPGRGREGRKRMERMC